MSGGSRFRDTVELVLAARDLATREIERVRKKVRDVNRDQTQLGGKLVRNALRATSAFGGLELGVGGVNAAIKALNGDLEDAATAVERLPAGIGPFARQLRELLGTATGLADETERIKRATEAFNAATEIRISINADILKQQQALRQEADALADSIRVLESPQNQRERVRLQVQTERGLARQRQLIEEMAQGTGELSETEKKRLGVLREQLEAAQALVDVELKKLEAARRIGQRRFADPDTSPLESDELTRLRAARDAAQRNITSIAELRARRQRERIAGEREVLRLMQEQARLALRNFDREQRAEVMAMRFQRAIARLRDEATRVFREQQAQEQERIRTLERESELRREQLDMILEQRRAEREAQRDRLRSRIDALREERSSLASRSATTTLGSQQVRFERGLRDQLAATRDDPILREAREARRQRDRVIEKLEMIERSLTDPNFEFIPARFPGGGGF